MWYVMSYNQARGIQSGSFQDLGELFLGPDTGEDEINWVPLLSLAQAFETKLVANAFIHEHWGNTMRTAFCVVWIKEVDHGMDRWALDLLKNREMMSKRLAGREIDRGTLIEKLSKYENVMDNYFTPRERWIFEILMDKKEN